MAAYSWFTTPSRYMIFPDRLWIAYGRPRVRYIFFGQIDQVELLKIPMGDRILVRLTNGRRHFLQPRDIDGFKSKIDSALEEYLREHPETQQTEET